MARDLTDQNLAQKLSIGLECPVCFEFLTLPIYSCVIGHMICKRCRPLVTQCPLCRDQILGTRAFFAEEASTAICETIRNCSRPKSSQTDTSSGEGNGDDGNSPVRCCLAVNGCRNKLVAATDYVDHLKYQHAVAIATSAMGTHVKRIRVPPVGRTFVKRGADRVFILEINGRSFVINMIQEGEEVRIWALTHKKPNDKTSSEIEISVLDQHKTKFVTWNGPVNRLQTTEQGVLNTGHYLNTSTAILKTLLQEDVAGKYWEFVVKIRNVSAPLFRNLIQTFPAPLIRNLICRLPNLQLVPTNEFLMETLRYAFPFILALIGFIILWHLA